MIATTEPVERQMVFTFAQAKKVAQEVARLEDEAKARAEAVERIQGEIEEAESQEGIDALKEQIAERKKALLEDDTILAEQKDRLKRARKDLRRNAKALLDTRKERRESLKGIEADLRRTRGDLVRGLVGATK